MGHSLGLGHSSEANSIMNPYYKDSQSQELGYDDMLGMHSLYSKKLFLFVCFNLLLFKMYKVCNYYYSKYILLFYLYFCDFHLPLFHNS